MAKGINIQNLELIARNGEVFTARYRWDEKEEYLTAHPVGTGIVGMAGKEGVSRVYKQIVETSRWVEKEETVEVSKDEAKELLEVAQSTNMVRRIEKMYPNVWCAWIATEEEWKN